MFKVFKGPAERAEIEFREAYEKGVRLGKAKWSDAVNHFTEAAKKYAEAGMQAEANKATALANLFSVAITNKPDDWMNCHKAMAALSNTPLDIGFSANSDDIAQQALAMYEDFMVMGNINWDDPVTSERMRALSQKYMELVDKDLVVWKLLKKEMDPFKQAQYLLGLASYIEARSIIFKDPPKSVSLLSEASSYLDLAGMDPLNVNNPAKVMLNKASKTAKCWFCGREVQAEDYHYLLVDAKLAEYFKNKYAASPQVMEGNSIVACRACHSSIWHLADQIAGDYYQKAMVALQNAVQQLNRRIDELAHVRHS
jgi:hypothetical protein